MKEIDVNKGKIIECARLPVALAISLARCVSELNDRSDERE